MGKKIVIFIFLFFYSCSPQEVPYEYPNYIGDMTFDPDIDDPTFQRCDGMSIQYHYGNVGGLSYNGELGVIKKEIMSSYKSPKTKGQTGFHTIRFVVNCVGHTGLFRSYSVNKDLKEFKFDKQITSQLLESTKLLKGWKIANYQGNIYDYYQYLTFKIMDGELIDIAP